MGTETITQAGVLLQWAPYCLAAAGACGLAFIIIRYLLKVRKSEGDLGDTVERTYRTIGFIVVIVALAGGGPLAIGNFVAGNPGQQAIESGSSGQMTPTNDWYNPAGVVEGGTGNGTSYTDQVADGIREQANQARAEGDELRAQNLEAQASRIEGTDTMISLVQQGLKFSGGGLLSLIPPVLDILKNANAAIVEVDADHNATPVGPLMEGGKPMVWCR